MKFKFDVNLRALIIVILIGIAATALLIFVRLTVIEPEAIGAGCAADGASMLCRFRGALVYGFTRDLFGLVSVIAGAFATVIRWRWVALIALLAGIAGAVLYRFELSGFGLLLGALVLARARVTEPTLTAEV